MSLTLKNLKLKKINAPYPIGYIDNFLSEESCKKLFEEIYSFEDYDDLVMNGRMRVNKGSNKFKSYLEKSPNLNLLYNELNNKDFFIEMKNKLDVLNQAKWAAARAYSKQKGIYFRVINEGDIFHQGKR